MEHSDTGPCDGILTDMLVDVRAVASVCRPLVAQIAQRSLAILTSDLTFIKDQITVSEVNIARMHNHNVRLRKLAKEAAAGR